MRSRIRGLASALTGIVLAAGVARAQAGTPTAPQGTLAGIVQDSLTGLAVADAPVRVAAGWPVPTDSAGRFLLEGTPPEGQVSIAVEQLGYADYFAMVDVKTPRLVVRLAPDLAAQPGLKNIADELRHMTGFRGNRRLYTRHDLLTARTRDLRDFLKEHGVSAGSIDHPRPPQRFPTGRDDSPSPGFRVDGRLYSFENGPTYDLTEVYAVVVTNGGASAWAWTTRYIDYLARSTGHLCTSAGCS